MISGRDGGRSTGDELGIVLNQWNKSPTRGKATATERKQWQNAWMFSRTRDAEAPSERTARVPEWWYG